MSNEGGQPAAAEGTRWGDTISDERQAELDGMLLAWTQEANHGERESAFAGMRLTGAEVFYLAARAIAGADGDLAEATDRLHRARSDPAVSLSLDLSGLHLERPTSAAPHLRRPTSWVARLGALEAVIGLFLD